MATENHYLLGITVGDYHLEEMVRQTPHGPLFLARHRTTNAMFLLLVLAPVAADNPRAQTRMLGVFQQTASPLQALRHPYIIPVLEMGHHNGMPFLLYPHVSTRTFTTRLEQAGPLDVTTTGRYLDQLAGALEYAHEHAVVHGALSTDMLYLQLDGRLMVAGLGVQHILERSQPTNLRQVAYQIADVASPEQLLGQEATIASDVYAMGAVLYRLLTGHPVYAGRTADEIAQQTLHAPIPPLSQHRPDLPRELGELLAQALAKAPEQRFLRPGVLANAYHLIIDPHNTARIPFVEGAPLPRAQANYAPGWPEPEFGAGIFPSASAGTLEPPSMPIAPPPPPPATLYPAGIPYPMPQRTNRLRIIIGGVLALLLVGGAGLAFLQQRLTSGGSASGQVRFFDAQGGASNGLSISITGLAAPPAGMHYQAWLIDPLNERVLALGALQAQSRAYALTYTGPNVNLLGAGSQVEITQEEGAPPAPLGKVVLVGSFPPLTFVHIRHLLLSFPTTPGKIGLLSGVLSQTHLLSQQAHQLAASGADAATRNRCLMANMLAILEGAKGANVQALPAACQSFAITAGDGFGLLPSPATPGSADYSTATGYIAEASAHATLAIQQPDATRPMKNHASRVIVALGNIKGWATTLDGALVQALAHPTDAAQLATIVTLADETYAGQASGTTTTVPSPAAGGAQFAYAEGQQMADLPLAAPAR